MKDFISESVPAFTEAMSLDDLLDAERRLRTQLEAAEGPQPETDRQTAELRRILRALLDHPKSGDLPTARYMDWSVELAQLERSGYVKATLEAQKKPPPAKNPMEPPEWARWVIRVIFMGWGARLLWGWLR